MAKIVITKKVYISLNSTIKALDQLSPYVHNEHIVN